MDYQEVACTEGQSEGNDPSWRRFIECDRGVYGLRDEDFDGMK